MAGSAREFCRTLVATAQWGTVAVGLWQMGTGNNSYAATIDTSKRAVLVVTDASGGTKTFTSSALALTAGTQGAPTICYSPATHTARVALGAPEATVTSAGTGVAPTTIQAGFVYGYDGTNYLNGSWTRNTACLSISDPTKCQ